MKRVVVLLLALAMIFALAACGGKTTCDVCGESKKCDTIEVLGEKMNICKDCQEEINSLASGMLGGNVDIDVADLLG